MPTSYYREIPNNTHPVWWKDPGLRINMIHCFGTCFATFYLGYDQNLLTGLQAIPQWNKYFGSPKGTKLGLISASLFLPSIPSAFVGDWVANKYGRRWSLWLGSLFIIIGAIVNGPANGTGMFIGARVILGIGGGIAKTAAPALLQELAHPRLRAILGCIYYPTYFTGNILAAWLCYASLEWNGNVSWRFPVYFQVVGPALVIALTITSPESPRWLVANGRKDEAFNVLTKYHANGDRDDPLVKHTFNEICYALEQEALLPKSRYIDFLKTPGNRRRILVACTLALATNWVGNGIISYYLTPVLKSVGFSNPHQILGITAGLAMWNFVLAFTAGLNVERTGRRPLFFTSIIGMLLSYCLVTAFSARFAATGQKGMGIAVLPFLYIYYGFYDIGFTPLPYGYTTEILPYNLRTKGLAIFVATQNVGNAFNQFVNPVALDAIAWKYYLVYIGILAVYLVFAYYMYPETKHRTIEEVSIIFDYGRKEGRQKALEEFARRQREQQNREEEDGFEPKPKPEHVPEQA